MVICFGGIAHLPHLQAQTMGLNVFQDSLIYEKVSNFSEGKIWVFIYENMRNGFMDKNGNLTFPIYHYELTGHFHEGLCHVQRGGMWGYIDTTGVEIIPPQYTHAEPFRQGRARVMFQGQWGYIRFLPNKKVSFQKE